MRGKKELLPAIAAMELIPANFWTSLDFAQIFGRSAPVEVDIGCGDGSFLAADAEQNPQHDFLGIERLLGRARSACRKIAQRQLRNARVLRLECSYTLAHLLPPESIAVFHLLFPDPWPKRRHQARRVVTATFIDSIHRALGHAGSWRIVTDQADYFAEICRRALTNGKLMQDNEPSAQSLPVSSFQKHFQGRGAPVFEISFRKIS